MPATIPSFAKINLGLSIGPRRRDGFHELRTIYQTIALHDLIGVEVQRGSGIEIRCSDPRVPLNSSNTCYRIAESAMATLKAPGRVVIEIEKRLPVQGGLGAASGNAVAVLLALEPALKKVIPVSEKVRIAAEVGSDLPLFLIGGTVLGLGHGEEVYPLPDLPSLPCVVATAEIAVSTPKAFADWDAQFRALDKGCHSESASAHEESTVIDMEQAGKADPWQHESRLGMTSQRSKTRPPSKLTGFSASDRMLKFGQRVSAWLMSQSNAGKAASGVPAMGRGRAESPLLDLVRTGIENDFERVVFPQYPELREVKRVLEGAGALWASLSGSGSTIFGLFDSRGVAEKAAAILQQKGISAKVTTTLTRRQYWKRIFD
jgi:4-diphosphocytidyl-2-C-methyl-D-erythritol kinase